MGLLYNLSFQVREIKKGENVKKKTKKKNSHGRSLKGRVLTKRSKGGRMEREEGGKERRDGGG